MSAITLNVASTVLFSTFIMPIGTTSFGIALTPEMIENNARIEKEINQHIKDGYYKNWGL